MRQGERLIGVCLFRRGDGYLWVFGGGRKGVNRRGALWGVCEVMQSGERECVIVNMLVVSSSLQTGDPCLETGHLRLLQGDKTTNEIHRYTF